MKFGITALILLFISNWAVAADSEGKFSVRGAGLITCEAFVAERKARSEIYLVTVGWLDGYITALNEYATQTYDITSFETSEMLLAVINRHCESNPQERLFAVLQALFRGIHENRLQVLTPKQEVARGESKIMLYKTVLDRVHAKLAELGYYRGRFDGIYTEDTVTALKKYQTSIGFNPTGFPDQLTLWSLLTGNKNE